MHCKQFIELDISYPVLREDYFANIASFVPKLELLHIITDKPFSHSFDDSFHSMKNIQRVTLRYNNEEKRYFEKFWYFGKCLSEVMLSPGNGNRGGVGGYFEIPPWPKNFGKYPPLEILGKFFEKPGKTEKIR